MGNKYQAYPEYKDSGVEWLGEIPKDWAVSKIKFIAPYQVGWTPPTKNDANFEGENLWANISDLREKVIHDTSKKISDMAAKTASMDITPKGSLLYSFKLSVGSVSFAGKYMYTNEAIASFLEGAKLPLSYLYYVLPKFVIENASTNIYGARTLNQELISNAMVLAPSFQEAEAIANFLDHETAKIDTLIEKQQQLIKLLKEKRQAVISHAVTKGLNPNAKMRDSGVEWLGEVPEHWKVMQIRRILPLMEQGKSPECENRIAEDEEWGVLKTSCVNNGIYNCEANKALPKNIKPFAKYEVKAGDVLMSRASGSTDLIGSVAFVKETKSKILLSDKIFRLHLDFIVDRIFFSYLMSSSYMRAHIVRAISGAEGMANNVTKADIIGFLFALPPIDEQKNIVYLISRNIEKLDKLIHKAEDTIELSKERRTALISAAVTGKIDVRNWQAANG